MADVNLALDLVSNVQEKRTHRVRKFSFGDGYEQISADGVNTRMSEYDITTRPLGSTDALVLRNALDDVAIGDYFLMTLTPFSQTPRRYRLRDNSYSRQFLVAGTTNPNITTNNPTLEVFQFSLIEANID